MFEQITISGTARRQLALQTRRGEDIANEVAPDPNADHYALFNELCKRFPQWERRSGPVGIYNCAGLVWASRRTSICKEDAYRLILEQDEYQRVEDINSVKPGDIAIYCLERGNEIYHVGLVVELRELLVGSMAKVPWILSKLNDSLGEVFHAAGDYRLLGCSPTPEFWTDRTTRVLE